MLEDRYGLAGREYQTDLPISNEDYVVKKQNISFKNIASFFGYNNQLSFFIILFGGVGASQLICQNLWVVPTFVLALSLFFKYGLSGVVYD